MGKISEEEIKKYMEKGEDSGMDIDEEMKTDGL